MIPDIDLGTLMAFAFVLGVLVCAAIVGVIALLYWLF